MKGKAGRATRPSQESKNRTIASESTGESGHVEKLHVRLWHLTDADAVAQHVRFQG
jgi:hypothetical protein